MPFNWSMIIPKKQFQQQPMDAPDIQGDVGAPAPSGQLQEPQSLADYSMNIAGDKLSAALAPSHVGTGRQILGALAGPKLGPVITGDANRERNVQNATAEFNLASKLAESNRQGLLDQSLIQSRLDDPMIEQMKEQSAAQRATDTQRGLDERQSKSLEAMSARQDAGFKQQSDTESQRESAMQDRLNQTLSAQDDRLNKSLSTQSANTDKRIAAQQNPQELTSSTRTMIEAAPRVKAFVDKITKEIDDADKGLGPAASRWREFKAGKVGLSDPAFTQLRTNVGLMTTLLMRMHVGARGGEYIMKHFQDLTDLSKQSPENLKAALGEIGSYAEELAQEGQGGQKSTLDNSKQIPAQGGGIQIIRDANGRIIGVK